MISRTLSRPESVLLLGLDGNHVAEPKVSGFVQTPDGINLRYARWKPVSASSKGTIIFLNGRSEYIEKGFETIQNLLNNGFEVLSFDWRGQGGSDRLLEDRRKGYVDEFDDYVMDLETIIENVALPDCKSPLYIVAHSMGALVALKSAPKIPNKIRRMVLCSPLLGLGGQRYSDTAIRIFAGALAAVGLGDTYLGGGAKSSEEKSFEENLLTTDEGRFNRNRGIISKKPELSIGAPTANWVFAACKAIEEVKEPDFYNEVKIPILFILAGNDKVVDNVSSEWLSRFMRSSSTLTIDGARHELFQEADFYREQCLAALFSFIPGSDRS